MLKPDHLKQIENLPIPDRFTVGFFLLRCRSEAMRVVLDEFIAAACAVVPGWLTLLDKTCEQTILATTQDTFGANDPEHITALRQAVSADALEILSDLRKRLLATSVKSQETVT